MNNGDPVIACTHGRYVTGMVIWCDTTNGPCAHQYFKKCKGWYVLSDGAAKCPGREKKDGQRNETASDGGNAV